MTELNRYSKTLTQDETQPGAQAMYYAIGFTEADFNKAQVGIASMGWDGNPCNMHLNDLAKLVKESINKTDLLGLIFHTIGVSDGISMGTDGMRYSLVSRDIIADSIETNAGAQYYDAIVTIPGCDKNMPGSIMAMCRLNRPGILLYGGTIAPGHYNGQDLNIVSNFEALGQKIAGNMSEADFKAIVRHSCPGAGACGGMYTANTMASAIETLGMSLPYSSSTPAEDPLKLDECFRAGAAILNLLELDLKPRDIMTREAFENSMVIVAALGGSTNAVLHLIAMARSVNVPLTIDDFQTVSNKTPLLSDFKPSGSYVMEDLQSVGGLPAVIKMLLEAGLLHGDCLTVTGKTVAENVKDLPGLKAGQGIVRPVSNPLKATSHLQILKGNLAPEGAVAKITGKEGLRFSGPANVFDSEELMLKALEEGKIAKGQVLVIRYEGPKGGPGMPEMLTPTSAIMGAGLGKDVALITDGRFSGGSHGFIVGHITPEAQEGGPIALVRTGDVITIDASRNDLSVALSDDELAARRSAWRMPPYKAERGTLAKYIRCVKSAALGCVTDE